MFIKGDNSRLAGRRQLHHRLRVDDRGEPHMYIHSRCKAFWQTIPLLVESEKNPEDIEDKNTPDHVYDEVRYAIMSRPIKPKRSVPKDIGSFQYERRRYLKAKQRARQSGKSIAQVYR
jgi:hypothetical protein